MGWIGGQARDSYGVAPRVREDRNLLRLPVAAIAANSRAGRFAPDVPIFPESRRGSPWSPATPSGPGRPAAVRTEAAQDLSPESHRRGTEEGMIDALSRTYREMAAGTMGTAPDQVSIL